MASETPIRVLFVCAGNICRSPMAEAVFAHKVRIAELDQKIITDSAGTGAWHIGDPAQPRTLEILKREKIPYNGLARQFTAHDLESFDYIVTMDEDNLAFVQRLTKQKPHHAKLSLFLDFARQAGSVDADQLEVPDPYYNGRYEEVFELVNPGADALLNFIRQEHDL